MSTASIRPERFEIKLNFGADQIAKAMEVFGLDLDAGKDRSIWFGEIRDGLGGSDALPLSGRGVILRVRAKKKGDGDVTLKLRGPDGCLDVTAWGKRTAGFEDAKLEGDWAGRRLVSASAGHDFDEADGAVMAGPAPSVEALMSAEQRTLAVQLLIPLDPVTLLGPIAATKWDPKHAGDVAAELWTVDDLRFLEVSVVTTAEPEKAQAALEQRARDGGLDLAAGETKTSLVLTHLAKRPALA